MTWLRKGRDVPHTSSSSLRALWPLLALLAACTVEKSQPNLLGQDVHLTVLHTSDVHSRIFPYTFTPNTFDKAYGLDPKLAPFGGAARMKTLIDRQRARSARVIQLDSGDCFQGAPVFNVFAGEAEMRAMTELGVDAAALGNHEFDKGPNNLATQIGMWAGFPILAANYQFQDYTQEGQNSLGQVIKPYTILNVDGLVVGVIGFGNVDSITNLVEGGNNLGVTPMDTEQTVDYYAKLLRPQVDLLVAVSHLGLDEDETTALTAGGQSANDAVQARGDLDVVFGGHLHIVLDPPKLIPILDKNGKPTGRNTILVHSGAFAKTFGRLDLVVHVNSKAEIAAMVAKGEEPRRGYVAAFDYKVIPVVARQPVDGDQCVTPNEDESGQKCTPTAPGYGFCRNTRDATGHRMSCTVDGGCAAGDDCLPCLYCHVPEDPDMQRLLEPYELKMNQSLDLTRTFAAAAVPSVIARSATNGGDSQLGNLVASSMRFEHDVQADFALTNSLGIRADFDAGPLTLEELYNVFPFENTIEIMYLSGNEVQEMLDFVSQHSGERGCKSQAQVSGISFVMDCTLGKADLILTGSGRQCTSNDQCPGEVCGATLGFCENEENRGKSTLHACTPGTPDACGSKSGETCIPSNLDHCGKLLNPLGSYRVAVNDYIADGGSGFVMLKRNTAKFNTGISLRDALIDYLQRLDNPQFEGAFQCDPGQPPSATSCHGALRCDDPQWKTNPYLMANAPVAPDVAARACPGKSDVSACFGPIVCVLPHNQAADGRILPRLE